MGGGVAHPSAHAAIVYGFEKIHQVRRDVLSNGAASLGTDGSQSRRPQPILTGTRGEAVTAFSAALGIFPPT
jgi:hypothetical protein